MMMLSSDSLSWRLGHLAKLFLHNTNNWILESKLFCLNYFWSYLSCRTVDILLREGFKINKIETRSLGVATLVLHTIVQFNSQRTKFCDIFVLLAFCPSRLQRCCHWRATPKNVSQCYNSCADIHWPNLFLITQYCLPPGIKSWSCFLISGLGASIPTLLGRSVGL